MFTTPRERDPFGYLNLRSLAAQTEQEQASDARRYLRRRREVFLCILVALLGVLVARSIPLVAHEQELCDCRAALHGAHRPISVKHVLAGLTPLRAHDAPAAIHWRDPDGVVDVFIADEGAFIEERQGRVVLAEHCASSIGRWTR